MPLSPRRSLRQVSYAASKAPKSTDKSKVKSVPKPAKKVPKPEAIQVPATLSKATPAPPRPRRWVIVQLSSNGEREKNIPAIVRAARQILGNKEVEVCVPAISQKVRDDSHTMFYWDGYVFVEHIDGLPYMKLQETMYFQSVLCQPAPGRHRQRMFSFLQDKDLEPMHRGLQNMKLGKFSEEDEVKIVKGQFRNLTGKVSCVHEDGENVQVYVGLRSKQILMDFPASYLTKIA